MKVKKIIRYKKGFPLCPFYYDVCDQEMRLFDSRTDKPVFIYTLDFDKSCSSHLYVYIGHTSSLEDIPIEEIEDDEVLPF